VQRKIFRAGNSVVVALPKDALDALHLSEGAEETVELDRERGLITIGPSELELGGVDETFARQVAEFIETYRPALQALAE
jgi:antitoxin component of MazEF toxin-antitoxin module